MSAKPWYSLDGKKVWVFGSAGYFGSQIVGALDSQRVQTLCVDLGDRASEFVSKHSLKHVTPLGLDTSAIDQLEPFVEENVRLHGLPDGMVNLTYTSSGGKHLHDLTPEDFTKPFAESVTSFFVLSRALAERMKARGAAVSSTLRACTEWWLPTQEPTIHHSLPTRSTTARARPPSSR